MSFHTGIGMDGLIQAATLAASVPDLAIHIGVYLLALRHPVPVARQIAQIAESAPGRLHLGIGVGGEDRHEVEICGVDPKTRGRRTSASSRPCAACSGKATSHDDEFFSFEDARILPAPDPPVPIVIGGRPMPPFAARRCSETAGSASGARRGVSARSSRRSTRWPRSGARLALPPGTTASRSGSASTTGTARERLAKEMQAFYRIPFEPFEKYSPYGTPEEVADFLAAYAEAGCRHFNVMPIAPNVEAGIEGVAEIRELPPRDPRLTSPLATAQFTRRACPSQ